MKLASLKHGRDGMLVVVARDLKTCVAVPHIAHTLQEAMDDWHHTAQRLMRVYDLLNEGSADGAKPFDPADCDAPLPRAFQWADGSAYVTHVELVRKARGAEMPKTFWTDPLMYQGGSDSFIGPMDPILAGDEEWGIDFEGEIAAVTDDVPMGIDAAHAEKHIKLLMLVNDVSLRNLIPGELAKGFGFFQAKPATAFSPVAVTPDELSEAWSDGKVHLPLTVTLNGEKFGAPNAGEDMTFNFAQLIAHAAKTRFMAAGSIVGSGTVSNKNQTARFGLSGRAPHAGNHRRRQARNLLHEIRRSRAHRDVRSRRPFDLRRHRPCRRALQGGLTWPVPEALILHTYFRSSAAYRVRIALNLKGAGHDDAYVHLRKNEQMAEAYRALNPQGWCRRWCMMATPSASRWRSWNISTRCSRSRRCCRPIRSAARACARSPMLWPATFTRSTICACSCLCAMNSTPTKSAAPNGSATG